MKKTIWKEEEIRRKTRRIAAALSLTLATSIAAGAAIGVSADDGITTAYTTQGMAQYPDGAYRIDVIVNGRRVLEGRVFNLKGSTYVPMFAFADWQGNFSYSYNKYTRTATVKGESLEINATVGKLYISANGRYFYTGNEVLLHNGEVYVPILTMVKALNGYLEWSLESNAFIVRSGDTRRLKTASQVYNDSEVYWLARIISAEAGAEPMQGKIAVGNVVLNRVRSQYFPNTIYGVIFDKKFGVQFSPVANGTVYNMPTVDSVIAAKICLEGYTLSDDILYFMNPSIASSSWISKNRPYAFTVGKHVFYN